MTEGTDAERTDAERTDTERTDTERTDSESTDHRRSAIADRIVVSYPADLSSWGRFQVEKPAFRAFLRKTRDRATEGESWEEFVGVGCCGNTLDVPLRVERVDVGGGREDGAEREDGAKIGERTEIEYTVRESCGLQGSWRVQSAGGPSHSSTAIEKPH